MILFLFIFFIKKFHICPYRLHTELDGRRQKKVQVKKSKVKKGTVIKVQGKKVQVKKGTVIKKNTQNGMDR